MKRLTIMVAGLSLTTVFSIAQGETFSIMRSFGAASPDGTYPLGRLTLGGSTLYGTTWAATNSLGVLFKIGTDGTGYSVVHSFNDNIGFGLDSALTLIGSTLYGTTYYGEFGTVFQVGTDGTGYRVLHTFANYEAMNPTGGLALGGSTLYGTTAHGTSVVGPGSVFRIDTTGANYGVLHWCSDAEGSNPFGGVTLVGSTLYGTTDAGGSVGQGVVFKMNTDGTGYQALHSFTGDSDGKWSMTPLTLVGSTLFGTTSAGGIGGKGTIFKIDASGNGYEVLHSFSGDDGNQPLELTPVGSTLYGTTMYGGSSNKGTIFRLGLDGAGFSVVRSFAGGSGDGDQPHSGLILGNSTLYGTTFYGGTANEGVLYSLTVPEPSTLALLGVGATSLLVCGWWRRRRGED
jgi:uncharacterized repeat protein (TIGR03803 family)